MQLGIADKDGKLALWCNLVCVMETDELYFDVINGAWRGYFKTDCVRVEKYGTEIPGTLIWASPAPFSERRYGEAMIWIEQQISDSKYVIPLNDVYTFNPLHDNKFIYDLYDYEDEVPF